MFIVCFQQSLFLLVTQQTYATTLPQSLVFTPTKFNVLHKQEAQLSQRDSAKLLVIEYLAKSLKHTQGHAK